MVSYLKGQVDGDGREKNENGQQDRIFCKKSVEGRKEGERSKCMKEQSMAVPLASFEITFIRSNHLLARRLLAEIDNLYLLCPQPSLHQVF